MANQRLNALINIGGTVSKAFTSSVGLTQEKISGIGDAIKDVERQQRRVDRFDIPGLQESRDQLRQARRNVRQLSGELEQSRASTREAGRAYDAARDRVADLADQMRRADEPSEVLRHDFEEAKKEAERLGKAFTQAEKETSRLAREQKTAKRSASALDDQFKEQLGTLRRTRDQLQEAGVDTSNLSDESERLARKLEKLKKRQEAWQRVQSSGGDIGSTFSKMNTEVGALARNVGVLGGTVTAVVGGTVHTFAASAEETDQWAKRLGLATSELSQWQYAGQQFGVQSDAMIDAFKEMSMRADEFVTTGAGPAAEAFQRLGLSQEELNRVSDDTGAMMGMVLGKIRQIDDVAKRQRIVDEVFGGQGGEQLAEMASLSADELGRLMREADKLGVTIGGKAAKDAREYMTAWRGVKGAMMGVRDTFGAALMPIITRGFNRFTDYVKANRDEIKALAKDLGSRFKASLPVIGDIARGFADAARTVGHVTTTVAGLVGGFDNLAMIAGVAFSAKAIGSIFSFGSALFSAGSAVVSLAGGLPVIATGIKAIGMALMTTPLGIVTALAGAAFLIYENWDWIGPWFGKLWDGIKGVAEWAWDGLKSVVSWSPLGIIARNWDVITGWFGGLWDGVKADAQVGWSALGSILDWSPLDTISNAWSGITGWFKGLFDTTNADADAAWAAFNQVFSWSPLETISNAWGGITGWLGGLWDDITGQAQKAIDWIAGKLEWVGNAFSKVAGWFGFGGEGDKGGNAGTGKQSTADAAPRSLPDAPPRPSFDVPDVQPKGGAAGAMRKVVNNITNNLSLTVSRREGEADDAYARRITDMVIEQLNEQQQGALYDHG